MHLWWWFSYPKTVEPFFTWKLRSCVFVTTDIFWPCKSRLASERDDSRYWSWRNSDIRNLGLGHLEKGTFNLRRATTVVVVFQLGLCSEKLLSFKRASERASSSILLFLDPCTHARAPLSLTFSSCALSLKRSFF